MHSPRSIQGQNNNNNNKILEEAKASNIQDKLNTIFSNLQEMMNDEDIVAACKDIPRLCSKIFVYCGPKLIWEPVPDNSTSKNLVDLLNNLYFIFFRPVDSNGIDVWLASLGGLDVYYSKKFQKEGLTDLDSLISLGISDQEYQKLEVNLIGHRKKISHSLLQMRLQQQAVGSKVWWGNVRVPYSIPLGLEEFQELVGFGNPQTLSKFIVERFGQCFMPLLKMTSQSVIVSFLGHLGESLYFAAGIRAKDYKGQWKVTYKRDEQTNIVSICHWRKEMLCTMIDNRSLVELCTMEWELKMKFDSLWMRRLEAMEVQQLWTK